MRASEYPIPDYACYVWHRGDGLAFAFPDGGTLFVPLAKLESPPDCELRDCPHPKAELPSGWRWLLSTLSQRRARVQEGKPCTIGTEARPTAYMLEQALRAHRAQQERATSIDEDIFAATSTEETGNE